MSSFEAQFVDRNYVALIYRVTSVMAIADELKIKEVIHDEKYAEIREEQTNQGKMRKLFESLLSGEDRVKSAFYYALRNHEPSLFKELGGFSSEHKPPDPDSKVATRHKGGFSSIHKPPNPKVATGHKEAQFVDRNCVALICRVTSVMAIADELKIKDVIHDETYSEIIEEETNQGKMRKLFEVLLSGEEKSAFYYALRNHEPSLFKDLGGFSLKHKPPDPDSKVATGHKEAQFVDRNCVALIYMVTSVMAIADELKIKDVIHDETYSEIKEEQTNQGKMRKLFEVLLSGEEKSAFYYALRNHEPSLFKELGGFSSKHKPSDPDSKVETRHKGWSDMILKYKASVIEKCKIVIEFNLPSDERVELADCYTEPVITQKSKEQNEKYYRLHTGLKPSSLPLSNDKNHSIRIDQLFSPDSDGNKPKTVILSGDSGRGKSFTLQKIMLDWASEELYSENFDVVFLLKCDEVQCLDQEMSLNNLLSLSCCLTSDQVSQILHLTPDKVLFLVDGIDKFDPHFQISSPTNPLQKARPMDTLRSLLNGQILPDSFLLVTTRSDADTLMNLLKGPQRFTEIMGFSERGVQEYFQKFFQDEQLFRKTYESVKTNESLLTACSVPLLCWMVCFCLKNHFTDEDHMMRELKTTTSIYVHFVSTLLEHHDQSQSVLTMLRSLGQLAEEGTEKRQVFFDEKIVAKAGLGPAITVFLYKGSLKIKDKQEPVYRFMHFSFQKFFTALYYVLLDKEMPWCEISKLLDWIEWKYEICWPSSERSNLFPSVRMFLCGLLNEEVSSSLFEKIKWTVPHTRELKENLHRSAIRMTAHHGYELLLTLHCVYELQNETFVREALKTHIFMDLSNISLRSTDCWVLLYCLQCCPHIRDLDLIDCDLTAEKLKILQPALCMCESVSLSVGHLSEVGDLIQSLGESKVLTKLSIQEDEYSAKSSRWSLHLSFFHEDVFLSLSFLGKNPSFPAVLNISLTCPQSEISSTDWTLFLQRLGKDKKLADDSSALDEHVSLLLSSFHSVGLKTLDLKLVSLNKSWASGIISLVQTCSSLQKLRVIVTGLLLEEGLMLLKKSLTDPHCTVIIEGWKCSKSTDQCKEQDWSISCNKKVKIDVKPNVWEEMEKLSISEPEPPQLNLHPRPVCQSRVHIGDSDQWLQVESSLCTAEGESRFRINTLTTYDLMDYGKSELRKSGVIKSCRKEQSNMVCQYKSSVIDRCKFVTEYNLPSDERVHLAARYTEPVIIQRSKEQTEKYFCEHGSSAHTFQLLSNDKNHSIRIDQLFNPDSNGKTPKTVILSGDSGRGKSFMLQKIMLDWASGELYSENFDVLFLLKCEELKCISEEMSLNEILSWSYSLTSDQISEILMLTPEKVLILIDGIDEFSFDTHIQISPTNPSQKARPMDTLRSLLNGRILSESFLLVTTRSDADTLINRPNGPQRFTEIVGFSERGVQEYFQKFFQDEKLFRKTYESVSTNASLLTACSVPLLCWMVCFCLKKHFTLDNHVMRELKTNTSIYVHFVSTLLEHHGQSQSILSMLRSLGQLAEEGVKKQEDLFLENRVTETGLDPATTLILYKIHLKRELPVFRFMHLSFQEFFVALYYVLLDEEKSWEKISVLFNSLNFKDIIDRPSPERRSNLIPSVMMFLCGLLNEKVSSALFEKIKWTVSYIIKLKTNLQKSLLTVRRQHGCELLFALHCLYELQDEIFVREALKTHNFMDLSNISLRSTDCRVLRYCLQSCSQIRDLNLMYCDLTAEKLKILQPALCMCRTMRLSVEHLSEAGDLIQSFGDSKILRELNIQEDEYSAESPRWSLHLSVTHEDVLLSLNSSEKNPSSPAVLNISLTCPQSEISSTDWTLLLQRLSQAGKVADYSPSLDEHVSLLLSSFYSVGLTMLDLELVSLNKSWASGIISLVQTCTSLQQLSVRVTGLLLEEGLMLLKKSLTDPHCTVIIDGRKCSKPTDQCKEQDWSHSCNEKVKIHFNPKELEELCTENTWSHCCNEKVEDLFTPGELEELDKLNISEPELSGLNLHPLPVCDSCVHIGDSDQWVQVEPSVCTDKGGSEFKISTPAGRFECSRTRMRWVCAGDVTLQYRAVDGRFLRAELERLQYKRIGPVIDVTVISGNLEEAHLPHYACLAESDPSLGDAVKVLSVKDKDICLKSVDELTCFHARLIQPSFCPTTVVTEKDSPVEQHLDLLIFMIGTNPLILHVYLFPQLDAFSKDKIMEDEKAKYANTVEIGHPRPNKAFQMETPHILQVSGADVLPEEGISFSSNSNPNFFMIRQGGDTDRDVQMTLIRQHDGAHVWKTDIWKEKLLQKQEVRRALKCRQDSVCLFDDHWPKLINKVTNPLPIADKLLHQKVISEEEYSNIRFKFLCPQEKMREICSIVRNGSDIKKAKLMLIIQQEEKFLFSELENPPLP